MYIVYGNKRVWCVVFCLWSGTKSKEETSIFGEKIKRYKFPWKLHLDNTKMKRQEKVKNTHKFHSKNNMKFFCCLFFFIFLSFHSLHLTSFIHDPHHIKVTYTYTHKHKHKIKIQMRKFSVVRLHMIMLQIFFSFRNKNLSLIYCCFHKISNIYI